MTSAREHNEMVDFVLSLFGKLPEGDDENARQFLLRSFVKRFPNTTGAVASKVFEDAADRHEEAHQVRMAELDDEIKLTHQFLEMAVGLPDDLEMGEVVALRAKQGHPFALWVQQHPEILEREIEVPLN